MAKKPAKSKKGKAKPKYVYLFGGAKTDGKADMKELLGGKGANLAEMGRIGLPVPPGFTITTEVCTLYYDNKGAYPEGLDPQVRDGVAHVEKVVDATFGDPRRPLLMSVRSGARKSMPGMMETVLNVGLTSKTAAGMIELTRNPRFVWDAYRRLITMYSDVVMEKAAGIEPAEGKGIRVQLEREMQALKKARGVKLDTELTADDLEGLCKTYGAKVKQVIGKEFPDDPWQQLWGAVGAVFRSWNGKRAVSYRRIEGIPQEWGTAVNVQAMVFGNTGDRSGTGVAFTRNPATGDPRFYGEWLPNAQGEDVVAGIRTPRSINEETGESGQESLDKAFPKIYRELDGIQRRLEKHYRDMQDLEFTIQDGKLYMLQTRVGKRNGPAAVRMAVDMVREKLISAEEAVERVTPAQLDELLHPILDPAAEKKADALAKGLPAGPGGATGQVVFTSKAAVDWAKQGKRVILAREETNPEDVEGMRAAAGILTAHGGMTSHAALVARGWGKCCIVGCGALEIDAEAKTIEVKGRKIGEGDWISLNGSKGVVYAGNLEMIVGTEENPYFGAFMKLCDKLRTLGVRTNADTPEDAAKARAFGAEGIGLFRTEHMFYGKGAEEPLFHLRRMILSETEEERRAALDDLFPYVKRDIRATLEAMEGLPVTIRLLDPPLHEFVPHSAEGIGNLAKRMKIDREEVARRGELLQESNPMMGHRGVRLGITYPEISEMQLRAIFEAAAELRKAGKKVFPEIMIPVLCDLAELSNQAEIARRVYDEIRKKHGLRSIPHSLGTMIEIPRAALLAGQIAETAEFFSFGTNDLTQMTFGFSRDDVNGFVPDYIEKGILADDPFQTLDVSGVGELVRTGIKRGRRTNPDLKVGICGEHGGDPASVEFCHKAGMNYVSCSPYRVPIARLAAAQAALRHPRKADRKAGRKAAAKKGKKGTGKAGA